MAEATPSPEVREALDELQQYLSDILPPLIVTDSIKLLLKHPPQLMASNIHAWTAAQYRAGTEIPVSDYLFHAVKKIHLMGEFRLVPREPLRRYIEELKENVLAYCPEADQEFLRTNLAHLEEATTFMASSVDLLFRQGGETRPLASGRAAAPMAPGSSSAEDFRGLRRFSLLLERLEHEREPGGTPGTAQRSPLASEALSTAARSARSGKEFEAYLDRLRELGIELQTADVFRSLGNSLPGWALPVTPEGASAATPASGTVEAMHRIVTQAEDPAEGARRFQEMVRAAIERFNDGSLAQAVTILELAERIIAERGVDAGMAEVIRTKGGELLDLDRLRRYADALERYALLRKVLSFFTAFTPTGLLNELRRELKRERRRLLLLLLEIHGAPAREEALDRLRPAFGQGVADEDWYYRRNLLYLLRRIPRPPGFAGDEDVDIAVRHAELRFPAPLVKEAIANLGHLKHEKSERTLIGLLSDLETMLLKPGEAPYDPRELRLLLDRVVAALARFGTPSARRAVVEHGLKRKAELGDTMARLAELAGQDLSGDEESVQKLLEALKASAPFKLFGLVLHQNDESLYSCLEALSTTPAPAVRQAFEGIVRKFPGQEIAKIAAKALSGFTEAALTAESSATSLSGDLELFGLPTLLQSLAESALSGSLALRDPKGETFGTISMRGGKLKACQTGRLLGEEAFYQLLERPMPGNFVFTRLPEISSEERPSGVLRDILPMSLEGMRRYDEFQQAAVLAPDEMVLKSTEIKPTPHTDEKDGILVKDLWTRVKNGATPRQCEEEIRADSYRIRRLLSHWVETGALAAQDAGGRT